MRAEAVTRRCSAKEKGVLKNFVKFSGKRLCRSLFLIKLQSEGEVFIEHLRKAISVCKAD